MKVFWNVAPLFCTVESHLSGWPGREVVLWLPALKVQVTVSHGDRLRRGREVEVGHADVRLGGQ